MSGVSEHFFEDSSTSRGAIGNLMYMCIVLSSSFQFLKNNTNQGTSKTKRDENEEFRRAYNNFTELVNDLPNTKPEECFEKFQPVILDFCNVTGEYETGVCDRYVNNGMWDICQSLIDYEQCGVISYEYSTEDYFRHPAFWGGCGFLIGCLISLITLLIISFCCSRCKKKKDLKKETGSGSASVEAGKGSKGATASDTKNSDEKNGKTTKPSIPKSQYIGDQFPADGGKKSVFFGAKTIQKPAQSIRKTADKPGGGNKKKKNKYGKDVGALTAMEVTMYK